MGVDSQVELEQEYLMMIAKNAAEKELELNKQIYFWKQKGKRLVYPDQFSAWETYVENRARDLFEGKDLDDAILVMDALEKGVKISSITKCFEKTSNAMFYNKIVAQTVGYFSKRGVEFFKSMNETVFKTKIDEPLKNFIKQIEIKNEMSEQKLQKS